MNVAAPFYWRSGAQTDSGRTRSVNQDAYLDRPDIGLWAVADGMGGHRSGSLASQWLVEGLGSLALNQRLGIAVEEICAAIHDINQRLIAEASAQGGDIIGSTLVVILAIGDHCAILWAGDSRAYRLRHRELRQITVDHTQVQEMIAHGLLTPQQAELHPLANVLVRAVGGDDALELDCRLEALCDRDRYLLCSDGLVKELPAVQIMALLEHEEPGTAACALVQAACDAGGRDNVTALVVDFYRSLCANTSQPATG